jgi:hypothetical protein
MTHERRRRGETNHPHVCTRANRTKPRLHEQPTKLVGGITEHKRGSHDGGRCGTNVAFQSRREHRKARAMSESSPDQHDETSTRLQNAIHLAGRLLAVGKVLQSELAQDRVEGRLAKGHRSRVPFLPLHRGAPGRRRGAGTSEHAGIEVETDHVTSPAHLCRGQARNHAGSTRHVERVLAFRNKVRREQ